MLDAGFVPCMMAMGSGFAGDRVEGAKRYLRYIIARYAARSMSWSPADLFTNDVEVKH